MRILGILVLAMGIIMFSCSKEEEWTTVDNFVQDTYKEMRDGALGGHHRCYRVNFPVTVVFPDGTTSEVEDREQFLVTVKGWKESNPDAEERPTLEFPFTITRIDGETIEVTSQEQVRELRKMCRKHNNKHRKCGKFARFINNRCFQVQLPILIVMADGDLITLEDRSDIIRLLKSWKENRPEEVPEVVFPITVKIKETGAEREIADQEAFEALVEECRE
ncbi:hypothetical protein [Portibacter marinus]|uniref:hypothetical protein n=1 Tax=Portibacter marinus TaxID=2898660 RepID=UPI001F274A72|nr:hypothetical protein [Portibacter marinus]